MQMLNVACGGTLDQHLADAERHVAHARARSATTRCASSPARWPPARSAPSALAVRSHHHQGVDRLGDGLVASGWADPGEAIEAIELPDRRVGARGPLAHRGGAQEPGDRRAGRGRSSPSLVAGRGPGVIQVVEPATEQVMAEVPRAGVEETDAAVARRRRPSRPGARSRRATGRCCCCASRTRSPTVSRSSRCSRRATPASRSATRAARSGWSSSASATTPARRSACSARRSRSRAAST